MLQADKRQAARRCQLAVSPPTARTAGHVAHRADSRRYGLLTPGGPKLDDGSRPTGQDGVMAPRAIAGDPKTL